MFFNQFLLQSAKSWQFRYLVTNGNLLSRRPPKVRNIHAWDLGFLKNSSSKNFAEIHQR